VLPVVQNVAGSTVNLVANEVVAVTTVVVTIQDAVGQSTPVTVTVRPKSTSPGAPLVVLPSSVVMSKAVPVTLTISGGVAPFKAYSSNPAVIPVNQSVSGNSIVLVAGVVAVDTNVAITVQDSAGQTVVVDVLVQSEASTPPAFLPPTAVIFSGVPASIYVTGGAPPYLVFSSNPTVLPVTQSVSGTAVPLLAGQVSADTTVILTVQDSVSKTGTATIIVRAAPLLSAITVKPNFADCATNTFFPNAICSGQTGTAAVKLTQPGGGPAAGRQVRFDVVTGPYSIATTGTGASAPSQTIVSDAQGNAQVVIRANVDAPTQPAQIRATDIASGQQVTGDFLIVQRTDGSTILTVVPPEATFTAPYNDACTFGFRVDYFIYGGTPPYRITQTLPDASVLVNSTVAASGGYFEVISNGTCVNPQTFSIVDATGRQVTARFFNLLGSATRPPDGPPDLLVTPVSIGVAPSAAVACNESTDYRFVVSGGTAPYNAYPTNNPILPGVQVSGTFETGQPTPASFAATIAKEGQFFDVSFTDAFPVPSGTTLNFRVIDSSNPQKTTNARIRCQ
jgi:hypothetical protein